MLQIGYCTNVHAGADLPQTQANLERYALAVKRLAFPKRPMGIGLWLSASAAGRLLEENQVAAFADWLGQSGLVPFTLNGFPYGDFHSRVVKHQVYRPTWFDRARFDYTANLITILDRLLPSGMEGSISTVPICWPDPRPGPRPGEAQLQAAAENLRQTARNLAQLEARSGRLIYLCLEPEPGCFLQVSDDVLRFIEDYLLRPEDENAVRRHVRVCHDVCHQVVMFEEQSAVLDKYRRAGIRVGKVQVSAAVCAPFAGMDSPTRRAALDQLSGFVEERYLHQTVCLQNGRTTFYEDLPLALASADDGEPQGEWRTHFHVPVYLRRFGHLQASQDAILECLHRSLTHHDTTHFEVETYAWTVLPPELQQPDLAAGIAEEMTWFMEQVEKTGSCSFND